MSEEQDLHAQLAQRLFGWEPLHGPDPWYRWIYPGGSAHDVPAYSTDPAATALVWQWLETRGMPLLGIQFAYEEDVERGVCCVPEYARYHVEGYGATWQEALCRAALALAAALEGEKTP